MKYKFKVLGSIWAKATNFKIINIKILLEARRPDKIRWNNRKEEEGLALGHSNI